MLNNKYYIYNFKYKFYNYTLKKEFVQVLCVVAKNINDAERLFWIKINGREIEIIEVLYTLGKYRPYIEKRGRMIWEFTDCTNRYFYLNNKRKDS